jgi:hypothetical protein
MLLNSAFSDKMNLQLFYLNYKLQPTSGVYVMGRDVRFFYYSREKTLTIEPSSHLQQGKVRPLDYANILDHVKTYQTAHISFQRTSFAWSPVARRYPGFHKFFEKLLTLPHIIQISLGTDAANEVTLTPREIDAIIFLIKKYRNLAQLSLIIDWQAIVETEQPKIIKSIAKFMASTHPLRYFECNSSDHLHAYIILNEALLNKNSNLQMLSLPNTHIPMIVLSIDKVTELNPQLLIKFNHGELHSWLNFLKNITVEDETYHYHAARTNETTSSSMQAKFSQ